MSAGANSWKVTVPVGLKPPLTDAVSLTDVPIGPPADAVVAMAGVAWVMVDRLGRGARADRGVVGVAVVGGHPTVGAHRGGREVARAGAPPR